MCANSSRISEVFEKIKELAEEGVFEIWHPREWDGSIYIPYMMNDALECYIILKKAVLVGEQIADRKHQTMVDVHEEDGRFALVARQGDENTFTVFFEDAVMEKKYYRFDTICHFWEPGQEQWSQLVYIIGTMFDKYAFLGEESCNEGEQELIHLIEFAPFRYHAPAKQLFEELYDNTDRGAKKMLELTKEAGDFWYGIMVRFYRIFPTEKLARYLSRLLTKPQRYALYELIYKRAKSAASAYSERVYAKKNSESENDNNIAVMRKKLNKRFLENGFEGSYPDYVKGNQYVRVVEEHPFTIMDWDDFVLKQTLMVSECNGKHKGINMGFFTGKKLRGYFCKPEEFFKGMEKE